jgi:hypothetical protein
VSHIQVIRFRIQERPGSWNIFPARLGRNGLVLSMDCRYHSLQPAMTDKIAVGAHLTRDRFFGYSAYRNYCAPGGQQAEVIGFIDRREAGLYAAVGTFRQFVRQPAVAKHPK